MGIFNNATLSNGSAGHGLPFPCYPESINIILTLRAYTHPDNPKYCDNFFSVNERDNNITVSAGCNSMTEQTNYDARKNVVTYTKRFLSFYKVEAELVGYKFPITTTTIETTDVSFIFSINLLILSLGSIGRKKKHKDL